jgi:hypothetical protein
MDELAALQEVIQDLHELITVLSDPQATQVASQCLAALTRIQQQMMSQQQGTPQQAIAQRLAQAVGGGGGGGGQPAPGGGGGPAYG